MIGAWIIFTLCMMAMGALFLGGICACASMSDREIERLQAETDKMNKELDQL